MKKLLTKLVSIALLCILLVMTVSANTMNFTDVKQKDWFYKSVSYVFENNIMYGVSDTEFGPQVKLSRGMFVTILARLAGTDTNNDLPNPFTDVKNGKYYTNSVKWAYKNNIVVGVTKTTFEPNSDITREQMCVIIERYCTYAGITLEKVKEPVNFIDSTKVSKYARTAVANCQQWGLVSGVKTTGGYNFLPKDNATRAEAATIFKNFDSLVKEQVCKHTETQTVTDIPATCGKDGTGHIVCTKCGETVTASVVIPATKQHTPDDEIVVITQPDCDTDGVGKKVCTVCGLDAELNIKIPAKGHGTFASEVTKQPEFLQNGVKTYSCTVKGCGYSYDEEIPAKTTIKILALGNSFSVDAMEYLWQICEDGGATNVVLGNMYIGGCTLDKHWTNIQNDNYSYTYYTNTNGVWNTQSNTAISKALADEEWDIITVQQASGSSGLPSNYTKLNNILSYLKTAEPNAKVLWHMTWAYQGDSTHDAFPNYNKNQVTMYNAIVETIHS
ncbi:MAG: DUF4886 domain-containing protein, partial [Clostridia bacterium]|nr:DUF4886 domain-containing protein [Clostridia bacterium]